jgi:hypothetical protein
MTVIPEPGAVPMAASAAGVSSSSIVLVTRRSGREDPGVDHFQHRRVGVRGHPVAAEDA